LVWWLQTFKNELGLPNQTYPIAAVGKGSGLRV